MCVVVTPEHFKNVKDVLVYGRTTLSCRSSPVTSIDWYFQQVCDDFEHGLYFCSSPAVIATGHHYQIHSVAPGEHTLQIRAVTKNMTGLYLCRNNETQIVIDSELLFVVRKYNSCVNFDIFVCQQEWQVLCENFGAVICHSLVL